MGRTKRGQRRAYLVRLVPVVGALVSVTGGTGFAQGPGGPWRSDRSVDIRTIWDEPTPGRVTAERHSVPPTLGLPSSRRGASGSAATCTSPPVWPEAGPVGPSSPTEAQSRGVVRLDRFEVRPLPWPADAGGASQPGTIAPVTWSRLPGGAMPAGPTGSPRDRGPSSLPPALTKPVQEPFAPPVPTRQSWSDGLRPPGPFSGGISPTSPPEVQTTIERYSTVRPVGYDDSGRYDGAIRLVPSPRLDGQP